MCTDGAPRPASPPGGHNDRVIRRTSPLSLGVTAVLAAAALALSACSGSGSSTPSADGSSRSSTPADTSSTSAESPSQSHTVVQGVTLTAQGSQLKVGDSAKVSWSPDQKTTGVIKVRVTRLQQVPIGTFSDWRLTGAVLKSTPYYVRANVTNLGKSDLSGVAVPLYLLDGRNTLLQSSTFRAEFKPCPSRPLPEKFTHGKRAGVCLVYFAPNHGKLAAISFRPTQDFDAITWTGEVAGAKKH
jgi:hypothetical protein